MRQMVLDCWAILATSLPIRLLTDVLLPRLAEGAQEGPGRASVAQLLAATIRCEGRVQGLRV